RRLSPYPLVLGRRWLWPTGKPRHDCTSRASGGRGWTSVPRNNVGRGLHVRAGDDESRVLLGTQRRTRTGRGPEPIRGPDQTQSGSLALSSSIKNRTRVYQMELIRTRSTTSATHSI